MEEIILRYVIPMALGLLGGLIGSFIAPWVHWGVEKRKLRQAKRRELINSCRVLLTTDIDKKTFRETEVYAKLRPHLYQLVIEAIESDEAPNDNKPGDTKSNDTKSDEMKPDEIKSDDSHHDDTNAFKKKTLNDVARIEKEWVLI
jgi:hypothetical protein